MSPYIDREGHTLISYLALFRAGKIGPLRYAGGHVPIVTCQSCDRSRPDDGTPCKICGAYQHRPHPPGTALGAPATIGVAGKSRRPHKQPGKIKIINPRRKKHHG
jgi:hypothetical protein